MSEFVTVNVTSAEELLQFDAIRLRSWKGDYLHRPDSPQGVTTWSTGIGNEWRVVRGPEGRIMLRSWKGDFLHRPDSSQGVTTWSTGVGNEWTLEANGATVRLRSWKGDCLHRPDSPQGVTTWNTGIGNEWTVEALRAQKVAGTIYSTYEVQGGQDYGFEHGTTFTQRFQAAITSVPVELAVCMGSNQRPYRARLVIRVGDVVRFSRDFWGLQQRQTDWATVFPILNFEGVMRAGEWASFSITPESDTGIRGLGINDPKCPPGPLHGYGSVTSRFTLRGAEAAQAGTYPAEPIDPAVIRSTIADAPTGTSWALAAGATFTQVFTAKGSGTPRELGVVMGINQNPYGCRVVVRIRGQQVFDRTYQGLVQRQSDRATVFSLEGLTTRVEAGDEVAFSVTPNQDIGFAPIAFDEVGIQKGTFPGYGSCRAGFYLRA